MSRMTMRVRQVALLVASCCTLDMACASKTPAGEPDSVGDSRLDHVDSEDLVVDVEVPDDVLPADSMEDTGVDTASDPAEDPAGEDLLEDAPPDPHFRVVTFNTGTTDGLDHESDGDAYTSVQAAISNDHYGDGLAWAQAVEAVRIWFAWLQPEVVTFQEIFYSGECETIPPEYHAGFVCETWSVGDPTVALVLLGAGYQVACHPGKNDKCIAVKKSFGSIRQCSDPDFCLEGLDGERVEDCGWGARVARATIDLAGGGEITVVNFHGTSGILPADMDCRVQQVRQVFVDMDGEPGANGARNVVLGDLNSDPGRVPGWIDASVAEWNSYVGGSQPFQWVSPIGASAVPTYAGGLNIDHVISDAFTGTCFVPGVTPGYPPVYANVYFDHRPLVCEIGSLF
jgi:hypothetical protein